MALIVEDGTGLPDADSYQSVAGYRAYWAARGVDVSTQTDAQIEAQLREGTAYIDTIDRYKAQKVSGAQAREFPRVGLTDWSGYSVTGVPQRVRDATCELAFRANTESLYVDLDRGGQVAAESVAGISVSYFQGAPVGKVFRSAMMLLAPFVRDKNQLYVSGSPSAGATENFSIGMHDGGEV